ncbi:hypothetical protein M407DRAFT_215448 [Tulasnella calospora MUT 4182]|uniref:Uncharacterized protein n=1 Tax=Tulasnella calospora MUT 4182 TaxID=1051891 RepID=A0A0C3QDV4_9AGAM|nr:hypothetical protein M407DRAFT_215448 [Tulasnella calospora MUT 4182]
MEDRYKSSVAEGNSASVAQISWRARGVPMELIMNILLSALSDLQHNPFGNEPSALKCLYKIRLVNSAWCYVIDVALERSKDKLLSILCRSNAFAKAPLFMSKITPHIERWGVVDLSDMALEHLPQTRAPRLQELILTRRNDISVPKLSPGVFGGNVNLLQRLALHHVTFAGEHPPDFGKNLRSLVIRQSNNRHTHITYTHIYRLLLLQRSLVEVEIQACQWSHNTQNLEMLADIDLPSLRSFKLLGLGSNSPAHTLLLQKIKAPNCTSFEFRIHDPIEEPLGVLWAVAPYFASVVTAIPEDLKFSLVFDPDFTIAIGRGEKKFKVTLSDNCRDAGLDWVANMLARYQPKVTCFSISGLWTRLDEDLFHVGGSMLGVWNALGRPMAPTTEGSAGRWLLPDLERLVVKNREGIEELHEFFVAAVQAREVTAVQSPTSGHSAGDYPKALTNVEYQSGPPAKQDRRLFDLLGGRLFVEYLE